MNKSKEYCYKRWLIQAPFGLMVFGAGICLALDAATGKANGNPWFWYGTFALVTLNSGLCLFGDAILWRVRYEAKVV